MKIIQNRQGLSTIELLITFIVSTLAIAVALSQILTVKKSEKFIEDKSARIFDDFLLKKKLSDSDLSLEASAKANSTLCPCILGGEFKVAGVSRCNQSQCGAEVETEFDYYDPENPTQRLAGTSTNPVKYSTDGKPCQREPCAFSLTSKYKAHCPGDSPTCDHADYVMIFLTVNGLSSDQHIRTETTSYFFPITLNYPPFISPVLDQLVALGSQKQIAINANTGHANENQGLYFTKCNSEVPAVATVSCYKIIDGVGQIIIKGITAGTTKITLQVSDSGESFNLSEDQVFTVTVPP